MQKNYLKTSLFILLSLILVYFVFRNVNFKEIAEGLKEANWFWLGVSILIAIFSHLFRALRWDIAIEPTGYRIKNSRSFYAVMIGYLVNLATARGGEVARCAIINQTDEVPLNILIGTVITERLVDLLCLISIVFIAFFLQMELLGDFFNTYIFKPILGKGIVGIIVIGILVFCFLFLAWLVGSNTGRNMLMKLPFGKKVVDILNGFVGGLSSIAKLKRPKRFVAYTLGIWLCYWFMTYAVFFCFDFSSGFSPIVGLTALIFASLGMIIPAPGGMGALALVIHGLTLIYGFTSNNALLLSSTSLAANIILITIGGIISLILLAADKRKNAIHG